MDNVRPQRDQRTHKNGEPRVAWLLLAPAHLDQIALAVEALSGAGTWSPKPIPLLFARRTPRVRPRRDRYREGRRPLLAQSAGCELRLQRGEAPQRELGAVHGDAHQRAVTSSLVARRDLKTKDTEDRNRS